MIQFLQNKSPRMRSCSVLLCELDSASNISNVKMSTKNVDDLLIFGYACKIFRDDEKALHIDQGRHLIPWMGDNTLKIDRYDVRAALPDISQYEPPPGGYDNRLDYLTAAEQRAEQLCEEERYFSLYNNDFEEDLYKEEKQKRQAAGYGQVGFNYDQSMQNDSEESTKAANENKDEQPDEVYIPNPRFYIPSGMELPETTKLQAIIEKTAKFISTQGPQMEILIKAKQANNPLFDFLNQSGRLNPFYKHTLQAMKDGNYPSSIIPSDNNHSNSNNEAIGSMYQSYYSANQTKINVPVVKYKPSADCAYTQLISKIKGVPISFETSSNDVEVKSTQNQLENEKSAKIQSENAVEVKKISSGLMLAQYYNSDSNDEEDDEESNQIKHQPQDKLNNTGSHQNSTEDHLDENPPPGMLVPPIELRIIIDKTALYVLKNGKDFEDILRAKNDQRFTFLQYKDPYYKYYTYKVTGIVCPDPVQVIGEKSALGNGNECNRTFANSKPITPVSFSIKPKEDAAPTSFKPVLPLEHSSDEEVPKTDSNTNKTGSHSSNDLSVHSNEQQQNVIPKLTPFSALKPKTFDDPSNHSFNDVVEQSDSFFRDAMLEQQNRDEKRQLKRAEDKVKDRLAQIAREKLGILSKEKQLQLERKRRAMAFLNQINGDENAESKADKKIETVPTVSKGKSSVSINSKNENASDHSDSSDSVKFVMASSSTSICSAVMKTVQKRRHNRINRVSSGSDDVIEISSKQSSRSKSRSRSRSKSPSTRRYRHRSKHSKKKSKRHRNRSRSRSRSQSRSSQYTDYKRKKRNSPLKARKQHYDD